MRLNVKQGPALLGHQCQQLRKQEVGEAALKAEKQDQIYEFPFDPDFRYSACMKQQDSTGDGTVTEEVLEQSSTISSELLCL